MSKANVLKVVIMDVKEEGLVFKEINDTLKELQSIVGGYIEYVEISDRISIILNEEGKLEKLKPQLLLGNSDFLCGNLIFVEMDEDGNNKSVSREGMDEISKYCEDNKMSEAQIANAITILNTHF